MSSDSDNDLEAFFAAVKKKDDYRRYKAPVNKHKRPPRSVNVDWGKVEIPKMSRPTYGSDSESSEAEEVSPSKLRHTSIMRDDSSFSKMKNTGAKVHSRVKKCAQAITKASNLNVNFKPAASESTDAPASTSSSSGIFDTPPAKEKKTRKAEENPVQNPNTDKKGNKKKKHEKKKMIEIQTKTKSKKPNIQEAIEELQENQEGRGTPAPEIIEILDSEDELRSKYSSLAKEKTPEPDQATKKRKIKKVNRVPIVIEDSTDDENETEAEKYRKEVIRRRKIKIHA
ncbi:Oidioi.mRNA.OKI2018_I69.XSR.g16130.t1.cds [Oikopleura dioica]|uniref:Oidioi.mRNA.OKI2018_I69.XSR.g16130.t1.cds n=1 Tax=Oikopleura dioica TaxID=34765 RepID=A0ABN7SF41_OIKDI|nr:Oidioi.mRNA.OKI2018_I69.XSR.g16130.t1.cds [Oikopleura dioica]